MRATGRVGELRFRYQTAARLGKWVVEPVTGTAGRRFRISAKVVSSIDPWITRNPLDLYLTFGASTWVWHDVSASSIDTHFTLEVPHPPTIL